MKMFYLSLAIALTAALTTIGCGKDDPQNPSSPGTAVAAPAVPSGGLPVGCFNNGTNTCAQCPVGYTSNGSYCMPNGTTGNTYGCPAGSFWNGFNCQQIGYYTCPAGTTWNQYFYACTYPVNYYPTSMYSNCYKKYYWGGTVYVYVCY